MAPAMADDLVPASCPLTLGEAAERFGVSDRTIRRWVKDGTLVAVRVKTRLRFRPEDIQALIRSRLTREILGDASPRLTADRVAGPAARTGTASN
jgi:excisionase family DNA binding protein